MTLTGNIHSTPNEAMPWHVFVKLDDGRIVQGRAWVKGREGNPGHAMPGIEVGLRVMATLVQHDVWDVARVP